MCRVPYTSITRVYRRRVSAAESRLEHGADERDRTAELLIESAGIATELRHPIRAELVDLSPPKHL